MPERPGLCYALADKIPCRASFPGRTDPGYVTWGSYFGSAKLWTSLTCNFREWPKIGVCLRAQIWGVFCINSFLCILVISPRGLLYDARGSQGFGILKMNFQLPEDSGSLGISPEDVDKGLVSFRDGEGLLIEPDQQASSWLQSGRWV